MNNPFHEFEAKATAQAKSLAISGPALEMTFGEVLDAAKELAFWLRRAGVKSGDFVLIQLSPEAEVIAMLALMHEGAVSAHYASSFKDLDLARLGFKFIITRQNELQIAGITSLVLTPESLEPIAGPDNFRPSVEVNEESLVRVLFSSGTTGAPKGVPITVGQMQARRDLFDELVIGDERFMSLLSYDVSLGYITCMADLLGGRNHLLAGPADSAISRLTKYGVTSLALSPIGLAQVTKEAIEGKLQFPSHVKKVFTAGGPVAGELALLASQTLETELFSIYGSTEVGIVAIRAGVPDDDEYAGAVIDGVMVEIVDEEGLKKEADEEGRVRIQAQWQSKTYLADPEKAAEHFIDGYFYPGDRGFLSGKNLFISGRTNLTINLGGVKLDPTIIEKYLHQQSLVQDPVVCTFSKPTPVLAIATISDQPHDLNQIREGLKSKFGLIANIHVFKVSQIPRNSLGKPNRILLSQELEKND